MTKSELREYIKRELGYPMVKVELNTDQLDDCITRSMNMYNKWAAGISTQEVFFTKLLSGGDRDYQLPEGITNVIDMRDTTNNYGDANQLFTASNYMLNAGMLSAINNGNTYSLVSYHLALEYLDLLNRYSVSDYSWLYHKYNNTLTISPVPSATDGWSTTNYNFVLVRAYMKEGYDIDGTNNATAYNNYAYNEPWIQEYSTALAKIKLGIVRRKFGTFSGIGNTGIELDGDTLVSEGKEEKEQLEEKLKLEESSEGWTIEIG